MAVQAAITQFKKEFVLAFEQRKSLLSQACTKEAMTQGLTVTWLVSGAGTQQAVTRGQNGLIPYGAPTNTQTSATLVETHAPQTLTGFDIFASQGNQTQLLQINCMAILRRAMDQAILTEMANFTQDYPTSGTLNLETVAGSLAILGNAHVPIAEADNMFGVISPAALAYLQQIPEFTSFDYVNVKPLTGGASVSMPRWMGINWIICDVLSGLGTSAEIMYIFHRSAIGYATNVGEEKIAAGYDDQQDYSWARASIFHAAKIIQNTGGIKITHDGSAYVAT